MFLWSEDAGLKQNLDPFFFTIRGKYAEHLCQIYSSIIYHLNSTVAKEICGLKKMTQKVFIVQNVISTVTSFDKIRLILTENGGHVWPFRSFYFFEDHVPGMRINSA